MPEPGTGADARRREATDRFAGQLGLDGDALFRGATAAWSNLNPQAVSFTQALSVAAAVLTAASRPPDTAPARPAPASRRHADAQIGHQVATRQPSYFTATLTFEMTPGMRTAYAGEHGLGSDDEGQAAAARDVRDHLRGEITTGLAASHTIRKFTSYTITEEGTR
jgi:hypothetical protein